MSRAHAEALDRDDKFAPLRDRFALPEGVIYLDGNSLGALPKAVPERVAQAVATEWGEGLIRSWNTAGWIDLPTTVAEKIAPLIGAAPGTVMVGDSTSVNLFKVLSVALGKQVGRKLILSEARNFPTDRYIAEGVAELHGATVKAVEGDAILASLSDDVAVLLLTEVNYRTGARLDMAALTSAAHAKGILTVWDLAHSAGALPVDLASADADFAVGCGYKFLNGGPGAPAFGYAAPRHLDGLRQPLSGWLGHAEPFRFTEDYQPAQGIGAMRVGSPPILAMTALDAALDVFAGVSLSDLKRKSDALYTLFVSRISQVAPELEIITPADPQQRGSQISLAHPEAYAVMQALIARGVIGDFREPNIIRLGLAPLYLRFVDLWDAAEILGDIIRTGSWDRPELKARKSVV